MSQPELLIQVIKALDDAGVAYMVTGSIASSIQGEPRASHDIDVVVSLTRDAIHRLVTAFPAPEYYLDEQAMVEAVDRKGMFNLIDVRGGDKVDFWLLTDSAFDRSRFSRRGAESAFGVSMFVSAPEDTILMKLHWAERAGGSEKQFGDALRVYEVQASNLDHAYMEHWVGQLGISDLWRRLRSEAHPL